MTPAGVLGHPGFDHPDFHCTRSRPAARKRAHIISTERLHDDKCGDRFLSDTSDYPSNLHITEIPNGRPVPIQVFRHPNDPPNDVHALGDASLRDGTKAYQGSLAQFTSRSIAKVSQALHAQKVQETTESEIHCGHAAPPLSEIAAHRYRTDEISEFERIVVGYGWNDVGGGQALVLTEQEA